MFFSRVPAILCVTSNVHLIETPVADAIQLNPSLQCLCVCVSGTTAKHVVFLAGNTAKHGLRCKACKMSLHHKCENGVGQQRCMGKLVSGRARGT